MKGHIYVQLHRKGWLLAILLSASVLGFGQTDSLIFFNGNYMVGEAKSLHKGVLEFETDYSDANFLIEWENVKKIFTQTIFLITLRDGSRYNGRLESLEERVILIRTEEGKAVPTSFRNIVHMQSVNRGFFSRLGASVSLGLNLAKANNLQQLSLRANLSYVEDRWELQGFVNNVTSVQDSAARTERNEAGVQFTYFLPRDWYALLDANFLTNTEQLLDLRSLTKLGLGKYMVHTNQITWAFGAGVNYNNENFSSDAPDRRSVEIYFGSRLDIFDLGDFSLLTDLTAFPSITESGRWRVDFNFDAKYDFPLDFFLKTGFSLNFDNQPTEGGGRVDYVFQSTLGWEW